MLKPPGQVAQGAGQFGINREFRATRRCRVVGLIQDQQSLFAGVSQPVAQGACVGLIAHQSLTEDETGVGGPGIDAPAPLPPHVGDVGTVHHRKAEAKAALHLPFPLQHHRRWRHHHHALHLLPQQQLAHDQACLDRFAQAHVVGNEQAHPRHAQGFA